MLDAVQAIYQGTAVDDGHADAAGARRPTSSRRPVSTSRRQACDTASGGRIDPRRLSSPREACPPGPSRVSDFPPGNDDAQTCPASCSAAAFGGRARRHRRLSRRLRPVGEPPQWNWAIGQADALGLHRLRQLCCACSATRRSGTRSASPLYFTVLSVVLELVVGLGMALLLASDMRRLLVLPLRGRLPADGLRHRRGGDLLDPARSDARPAQLFHRPVRPAAARTGSAIPIS